MLGIAVWTGICNLLESVAFLFRPSVIYNLHLEVRWNSNKSTLTWSFETAQSEGDGSLFGAIRSVLDPLRHRDAFVRGSDPGEPVKWRACILEVISEASLVKLVRQRRCSHCSCGQPLVTRVTISKARTFGKGSNHGERHLG